ncbi:tRNA uridine-5-carboxymethylaminomethyl(34) synthesis GTPase MnmE [Paucibacter sp. DJ2R-2]|uniref:tRNA uridine-5-carboxymethylaminomethyl(34) synthesis GTPase MnmE n=1 Tax=Paucibacter sp. DJ2R-2 TaxID=2893558 RepID=UPI0021E38E13|nr:tRNA uridine-5-carboxymethylaminomethyl(34) synthesis GTPase MnmE [Paucibacter sp. DJ2R-2]MCV2419225.1 tRNA uridine-5-carboxymethylaminomethyl(34) synthesis GTPase MnmE [Paucibacter sp. DJ4R-1]MCV2437820.1 tRNA uridine-5-carboxymethylaminomethyl(34) synthesis GTPase MnmE [Paucibacter sp. DJ2R-2]
MLSRHHDPIAAIATAPGRGAVGIVRVSSPQDLTPLVAAVCGKALKAREATYLPFRDAAGAAIDQGLALLFPAPHSYTGEHVLELQAHGGPVVLQLLLARCLEAGREQGLALRLAEPGEFTQRAFLNGKLDLAQAEAVSDLIDASTEAAARSASRALGGALSGEVGELCDALIKLRMLVEATLDFPEEEIDFLQQADALGRLSRLQQRLDAVLDRTRQGALLREGIKVVLAGQPNVGKSSLLNALAGAELAIVTPIPGTTRDKVSQTIQIEGVPLHISDTAGLRDTEDEVERIGVARSWEAIADADVILFLHDLTRVGQADYEGEDRLISARLANVSAERILQVFNKSDAPNAAPVPEGALSLSAKSGAGLQALRQRLLQQVGWQATPEGLYIARERHVQALRRTREHLDMAQAVAHQQPPALDLLAEELRLAHDALGEITGAFSADDLLGEIFSKFCIGK